MVNENLENPTLEDKLLQIGSLSQISKHIEKSRSPTERSQLYLGLANLLTMDVKDPKDRKSDYDLIYKNIRISPEEAIRYSMEGTQTKIKEAEPLYKEEEKKKIVKEVISSMEKELKSAKNIDEAANNLSNYLVGLYNIPELDQAIADELEQREVERRVGVSMIFGAHGSIQKHSGLYEGLMARTFTREYIKEKKKGDEVIGYTLDKNKIKEAMDDVGVGALLYTNTQRIKVMKQIAEKNKK